MYIICNGPFESDNLEMRGADGMLAYGEKGTLGKIDLNLIRNPTEW